MPTRSRGSFLLTLLFGVTITIQSDAASPAGGQSSAALAREAARKTAGYPAGCSTPVSERTTGDRLLYDRGNVAGYTAFRSAVLAFVLVPESRRCE